MGNELEQTQLEIAKLQLEQERHKLAQMKKRQRVADDLSQGAVAVGGAAVRAGSAAGAIVLSAVAGGILGMVAAAAYSVLDGALNATPAGASTLYQMGFALGQHQNELVIFGLVGLGIGAYFGAVRTAQKKRRTR